MTREEAEDVAKGIEREYPQTKTIVQIEIDSWVIYLYKRGIDDRIPIVINSQANWHYIKEAIKKLI